MPHLSPLSWATAVPLFFMFMLLLMSTSWWYQTPTLQISSPSNTDTKLFSTWNWS
uniref:ATP synthase F0 subunit 8 n=1 Tax=Asychis amphiglyptus TaxID=1931186 RepID=UPI0022DCE19A|nr:ATP synthase F0 subunit 8 [Asychis amphiglyptus]UZZ45804.1 ATP synthase F0 subunit 8 [Asychis amphiglyptus]